MNKLVSKRDNLRASIDILLRISYHVILVSLSMYFFSQGNYLLSFIFAIPHWMTYSFMGTAGLSHELFHNSVFSNTHLNKILHTFFMILNWENSSYFKQTHWMHHKITLDEKDPKSIFKDKINTLYLVQLLSFDFKGFFKKINYTIKNAIGIIPVSKSSYLFETGSTQTKSVIRMARIILMFHIITSILFIYFHKWWLIFLINLAPFMISFFNRILGFSQHYGLKANNHTDYYSNCRTVLLSKFWSFFYSNMNYHIEHHMYPHLPYYRIKDAHYMLKNNDNYKNVSVGWLGLIRDLRKNRMFKLL